MINMDGDSVLQIGIGKEDDIVNGGVPFELEIRERIGNILPVAQMTITRNPVEYSYYATEHAQVKIRLGLSSDKAELYSKWQITSFEETDDKLRLLLTTDRAYVNDIAYKMYGDKQSCKVIEEVVKEYFETEIKLNTTSDKMKWIQHGSSMRDFVNEVWLHSWADQKLMMPIISAFTKTSSSKAGTFKLIDMTDHKKPVEITRDAIKEGEDGNKVWLLSSGSYKSNSGAYNTEIGNRKYSLFDIKDAKTESKEIEPKPVFKGDFNAVNIKTHNDLIHSISDNVHKNYAKAKASNLSRLSKFDSNVKRVVVVDYSKISIGDMVEITTPIAHVTVANDIQSGTYIVSEIKHMIVTEGIVKKYVKELTLRRDANDIKDDDTGKKIIG